MASVRKTNGSYQAQVRIGSASKLASVLLKAEARLAAGEEASLYLSLKAYGRCMPMDMANAVVERRSVELVIGSRTLMRSFCVFLLIF